MKYSFSLTRAAILTIASALFFIASCSKEDSQSGTNEEELQVSQVSGEAEGEAEGTFNEFFDDVLGVNNDVGVAGSGVFFGRTDSLIPVPRCFTITITHPNNTPFPAVVTLDFGTTGCPGPDGRVRRGKIITEYSARLIAPGAVATTHFENFSIDNIRVEGIHKITNTSEPPAVPRRFRIQVIDGKLTKPDGNFIEWNSTRVITQIEGVLTELPRDDVFKIEGSAYGRVKRGNLLVRWESSITEPLIRRFTCRWIVKGRIRSVRANLPANSPWIAILDFGAGNCDNQATLTVNGNTRQITLP